MKFILDNWVLILVAFSSGAMLVWPMVRRGGGSASVPVHEAVRLINREKAVLVDVGEPNEFAAGHAGGARNVPFGQLEGSRDLPSNKTLPLLVMCPSGGRAGRAAALLRKAGYEKAVAVAGGTAAWREAQLPIEKGERSDKGERDAKGERSGDRSERPPKGAKGEKADKSSRAGKAEAGAKAAKADASGRAVAAEAAAPDEPVPAGETVRAGAASDEVPSAPTPPEAAAQGGSGGAPPGSPPNPPHPSHKAAA